MFIRVDVCFLSLDHMSHTTILDDDNEPAYTSDIIAEQEKTWTERSRRRDEKSVAKRE